MHELAAEDSPVLIHFSKELLLKRDSPSGLMAGAWHIAETDAF
jgi:hypothetical protein